MLIKHLNNQLKEQHNQEDMALLFMTLTSAEIFKCKMKCNQEKELHIYCIYFFNKDKGVIVNDCFVLS